MFIYTSQKDYTSVRHSLTTKDTYIPLTSREGRHSLLLDSLNDFLSNHLNSVLSNNVNQKLRFNC